MILTELLGSIVHFRNERAIFSMKISLAWGFRVVTLDQ